jgi:hypothetical protein
MGGTAASPWRTASAPNFAGPSKPDARKPRKKMRTGTGRTVLSFVVILARRVGQIPIKEEERLEL